MLKEMKKQCPTCKAIISWKQLFGLRALNSCTCRNCKKKVEVDQNSLRIPLHTPSLLLIFLIIPLSKNSVSAVMESFFLLVLVAFVFHLLIFAYNFKHVKFLEG